LLTFAVDCSEFISLTEVFALPYKYRSMLVDCINKHVDKMNSDIN